MDWDEILVARTRSGNAEVGLGVPVELIERAEAMVGRLPSDYRSFLSRFGYASVGSNEIFGLGIDVPDHLNVVEMTLTEAGLSRPSCRRSCHL